MLPTLTICEMRQNGWMPVVHMARLLARLSGAEVRHVDNPQRPKLVRLADRLFPRSRHDTSVPGRFYVVPNANRIATALAAPRFRRPSAFRCLWLVDSFWTEDIPRRRELKHFDLVVYMQAYDRDIYESLLGSRAIHLPWGTDALGLGTAEMTRNVDLLRLGRQPRAWENEDVTTAAAARRGIKVGAGPRMGISYSDLLRTHLGGAKFVLAHSNLCGEATYTHPTKEYVTARWTDALAAGAVVAGHPPRTDIGIIDWPEALLPLPADDLDAGLDILSRALKDWTPDVVTTNHLRALERLDWRWRFAELFDRLGLDRSLIDAELAQIGRRVDGLSTSHIVLS